MEVKIIFINGAPRSGKDTLANELYNALDKTKTKMNCPIKEVLVHQTLNFFLVDEEEWDERYKDQKDEPWDRLEGMSQREALIWISEEVVKPKFGNDYYGQKFAASLKVVVDALDVDVVLVPDAGFYEELMPIIDKFGRDNCYMINTYKNGTSFKNDSRSLLTGDVLQIKGFEVVNNGTVDELRKKGEVILKEILDDKPNNEGTLTA